MEDDLKKYIRDREKISPEFSKKVEEKLMEKNRHNITIYGDETDTIQGDTESLKVLAEMILESAKTKRPLCLPTRWGLVHVENTDALKEG